METLWILDTPPPPYTAQLTYGPGEFNFAHLRLPAGPGPHPLIIYIHGGFWRSRFNLDHAEHTAAALTELGFATYCIEYRRIGNQGGGWPGTLQDVGQAADFLPQVAKQYNLDLSRVWAMGHSAGGHLALWLTGRSRIPADSQLYTANPLPLRGAVSLGGVTDLRRGYELQLSQTVVGDFLGGSPQQVPDRYQAASSAELLPLGLPQLLIHGQEDASVPFELSARYQQAAQAKGDFVTLLALPGIGHFEIVDPRSAVWPAVTEAILAFCKVM